jgi:hypothetical protein
MFCKLQHLSYVNGFKLNINFFRFFVVSGLRPLRGQAGRERGPLRRPRANRSNGNENQGRASHGSSFMIIKPKLTLLFCFKMFHSMFLVI